MPGPVDAGQLLDVDVQQVTRTGVFVSVGRQFGLEHADLVELEAGEDAADGGTTEAGLLSDLDAGLTLPPQPPDVLGDLGRYAAR